MIGLPFLKEYTYIRTPFMILLLIFSLLGTLDGGLGYVLAVPEKVYRRLSMLQLKLVNGVPHTAGLNPKAFRCGKHNHRKEFLLQKCTV